MRFVGSGPDLPGNRATRVGIAKAAIVRVSPGHAERVEDAVAVEEPLQIRVHGDAWATTLRTPGSDSELVAGLLLAEGLIGYEKDVLGIAPCGRLGEEGYGNVVDVNLAPGASRKFESDPHRRALFMNSACGVCGRAGIDDLLARLGVLESTASFDSAWLLGLVSALSAAHRNFARTGGCMQRALLRRAHSSRSCAKTSGATTPSTKPLGACCSTTDCLPAAARSSSPAVPVSRSSRKPSSRGSPR